jgi:hypothetical protein
MNHAVNVLEAAGIMGWFAICCTGQKYLDDGVRSRRAAEESAQVSSTTSALSFCLGTSAPSIAIGDVVARGTLGSVGTGAPDLTAKVVPPVIGVLGISGAMPTLPVYFKPFEAASARASVAPATAAEPLGFTSGVFEGQRVAACLEKSLAIPGPAIVQIAPVRQAIFLKNVAGY